MTRLSLFSFLKYSSIVLIIGGLFSTLLLKVHYKSNGLIESVASCVVYPVIKVQNSITRPVQNWISRWLSYKELQALYQESTQQLEDLRAQLIGFTHEHDYNQDTQELRRFSNRYNSDTALLAQVLLKNFDEKNHFFLLDAGARKGVMQDSAVVYKNCLIGRISQVYPYYSKATLISDTSCKIAAYCTYNRVQGIHEGENTLDHTKLAFVNHLETLKAGDLVVSSGEGLVFPRGFGLGYIESFAVDGFHYNVSLKPLVNFKELQYCYILQKGAEWDSSKDTLLEPSESTGISLAVPTEIKPTSTVERQKSINPVPKSELPVQPQVPNLEPGPVIDQKQAAQVTHSSGITSTSGAVIERPLETQEEAAQERAAVNNTTSNAINTELEE